MLDEFSRSLVLIGEEGMGKLSNSHIAVFGVGGVGGYALEALARIGVSEFSIFDKDVVSKTNINRQIIATTKTIGKNKVDVAKDRVLEINPQANVNTYLEDNFDEIDFKKFDYIIDAVDTVTTKINLVLMAKENNIMIISSMGMGNKLNPTMIEVSDIHKTSVCRLAKVMRNEMKKRRIKKLKVVFSKEIPLVPRWAILPEEKRETIKVNRKPPGSVSFVPSVAGLIIASEVVKDIIKSSL